MSATDNTKPYFPLSGVATDGFSKADTASATCFCGAVQLEFPTHGPGIINTFVCHCHDCRKITGSMFASNFTVDNNYITHLRGKDNLASWGQAKTIASGNTMTNYFCKTCGALMYRRGEPGRSYMRIGTVDDFSLHETALKPQVEIFADGRVAWLPALEGVKQLEKRKMKL